MWQEYKMVGYLHITYVTEAEDIKKRWQEYTEEQYKDLHDPDNHVGVITNLETDILEWKLKWVLGKHHYEQS